MKFEQQINTIRNFLDREIEPYGLSAEIVYDDGYGLYRVTISGKFTKTTEVCFDFEGDNLRVYVDDDLEQAELVQGLGFSGAYIHDSKYFWMAFMEWPKPIALCFIAPK